MNQEFTYGKSDTSRFITSIIIFLLSFIPVVASIVLEKWLICFILSLILMFMMTPIAVISFLSESNISVSEERIEWIVFQHVWKSISWKDVKRIRVIATLDYSSKTRRMTYCIDTSIRRTGRFFNYQGYFFRDNIKKFDELKEIINWIVSEYKIPVKFEASHRAPLKKI